MKLLVLAAPDKRSKQIEGFAPLKPGEVHVWLGSLKRPAGHNSQLGVLLARYLGVTPRSIRLGRESNGKPILITPAREPPLRFSVSHSKDRVLYALTRGGEVGVDVERFRPGLDWSGLADRFFAPEEARRLRRAGRWAGRAGFYRLWTQKEAMAKADGANLLYWLGADLSERTTPEWRVWSWRLPAGVASVACRRSETAC